MMFSENENAASVSWLGRPLGRGGIKEEILDAVPSAVERDVDELALTVCMDLNEDGINIRGAIRGDVERGGSHASSVDFV